jgi:NADPH:quinone reductase-like Zn-dependent oxidoreductase
VTRRPERLQQAHQYVYHRLENNIFQPIIDTVFHGLTSATDAHRRMESNAQFGKIVVKL